MTKYANEGTAYVKDDAKSNLLIIAKKLEKEYDDAARKLYVLENAWKAKDPRYFSNPLYKKEMEPLHRKWSKAQVNSRSAWNKYENYTGDAYMPKRANLIVLAKKAEKKYEDACRKFEKLDQHWKKESRDPRYKADPAYRKEFGALEREMDMLETDMMAAWNKVYKHTGDAKLETKAQMQTKVRENVKKKEEALAKKRKYTRMGGTGNASAMVKKLDEQIKDYTTIVKKYSDKIKAGDFYVLDASPEKEFYAKRKEAIQKHLDQAKKDGDKKAMVHYKKMLEKVKKEELVKYNKDSSFMVKGRAFDGQPFNLEVQAKTAVDAAIEVSKREGIKSVHSVDAMSNKQAIQEQINENKRKARNPSTPDAEAKKLRMKNVELAKKMEGTKDSSYTLGIIMQCQRIKSAYNEDPIKNAAYIRDALLRLRTMVENGKGKASSTEVVSMRKKYEKTKAYVSK